MNTSAFLCRRNPPPKALALYLLVVSLRPLLVNAQFRAYPSYTTPSWYIGLTFLLTALLIFGVIFLFYLRQRCLGRNQPVSPGSTIFATSHRGGPAGGLDPAAVKAFPVLTFREAARAGVNTCTIGLDCAVCLSAFEEDETLRLMPKCGHAFHPGCVDVWLASHTTCPCCRADLLSLPEEDDSPSTRAIKASNDVVVDVGSPPATGSEPWSAAEIRVNGREAGRPHE